MQTRTTLTKRLKSVGARNCHLLDGQRQVYHEVNHGHARLGGWLALSAMPFMPSNQHLCWGSCQAPPWVAALSGTTGCADPRLTDIRLVAIQPQEPQPPNSCRCCSTIRQAESSIVCTQRLACGYTVSHLTCRSWPPSQSSPILCEALGSGGTRWGCPLECER